MMVTNDQHSCRSQVDVIIVNYNTGKHLLATVAAALDSSLTVNIVIVDNLSTDGSIEAVSETFGAAVRIIRSDHNGGFAKAVNQGIRFLDAPYALLLNPDCIVFNDTIEQLVLALEKDPQIAISGSLIFDSFGVEQRGCRRLEPTLCRTIARELPRLSRRFGGQCTGSFDLSGQPIADHGMVVEAVSGACMLLRRSFLEVTGGLDEGYFLHCEDLDVCKAARQTGHGILFVPQSIAIHAQGVSSSKRPYFVEWHKHKGMGRYINKYWQGGSAVAVAGFCLIWLRFAATLIRLGLSTHKRASQPGISAYQMTTFARPMGGDKPMVGVIGASSLLGKIAASNLLANGHGVVRFGHHSKLAELPGSRRCGMDFLLKAPIERLPRLDALVCVAPIWVLPDLMARLAALAVRRLVVVSSTSAVSKKNSPSPTERAMAARLLDAEVTLVNQCRKLQIALTILRPTLIHGKGQDRNVHRIRQFIRRFRFFPIVGKALGLRQPIHVDDLAQAIVAVMNTECTQGKVYTLTGSDTVTYREMVSRIFQHENIPERIISLPVSILTSTFNVLRLLTGQKDLDPAIIGRMNTDLCFSIEEAKKDFDFNPHGFDGSP